MLDKFDAVNQYEQIVTLLSTVHVLLMFFQAYLSNVYLAVC